MWKRPKNPKNRVCIGVSFFFKEDINTYYSKKISFPQRIFHKTTKYGQNL